MVGHLSSIHASSARQSDSVTGPVSTLGRLGSTMLGRVQSELWRLDAACRGSDPELWFPGDTSEVAATPAKAICRDCPVRPVCLDFALANHLDDGIYGGTTAADRRRIRRRRRSSFDGSVGRATVNIDARGTVDGAGVGG